MPGSAVQAPPSAAGDESARADARFAWSALVALDLVFLLAMSALAVRAPCGAWENRAFGVPLWNNLDPGGPYVISSVHFLDPGYPPFRTGHPGTTLQLILGIAARVVHRAAAIWSDLPFVEFWARHIDWLFALSSAVVAALHVVSFHALHAYARHVGLRPATAFTAVLAYATSFPVLYYGGRVSPEPLLVTFTLWALLLAGSCTEALGCGRPWRAVVLAGGAGAASVLALFTKLHLAYALPLVVFTQILFQRGTRERSTRERLHERSLPALALIASSMAVFVVGSLKVNWSTFFAFWLQYTPGRPSGDSSLPLARHYWTLVPSMVRATLNDAARNLADHMGRTANGIFTVTESLFLLLAGVGLVWMWRRRPAIRSRLVWPAGLCVGLLPVVAYRGVWHYYIVYLAFAALGFAYAVEEEFVVRARRRSAAPGVEVAVGLVAALLAHSGALAFFSATKVHDLSVFRREVAPYFVALDGLPPGKRAAIVSRSFVFWQLDGGFPNYIDRERVGLTRLAESRVYVVKRADRLTPELVEELGIATVIDASSGAPRACAIGQWRFGSATNR